MLDLGCGKSDLLIKRFLKQTSGFQPEVADKEITMFILPLPSSRGKSKISSFYQLDP